MKTLLFSGPMGSALSEIIRLVSSVLPTRYSYWKRDFNSCPDMLSITDQWLPDTLLREYLAAGADVLVTNTFLSNRLTLKHFNAADYAVRLNSLGVMLAKTAIEEYRDFDSSEAEEQASFRENISIAGAVGPIVFSKNHQASADDVLSARQAYSEQISALVEAGADMILIETATNVSVALAALQAARKACEAASRQIPVHVEFTLDINGLVPDGTKLSDAFRSISDFGADSVGINCVFPAARAAKSLLEAAESTNLPLSLRPAASLGPENPLASVAPKEFADAFLPLLRSGRLLFAGCCCGASPQHVAMLRRTLDSHHI